MSTTNGDCLRTEISLEENGLRATYLVGLPPEVREHLRVVTLGIYRLVARYGLLYGEADLGREEAGWVGLYRDLRFFKDLASHYERQTQGPRRECVRDIRVLLEEAVAQARSLLPEGFA